MLKAVNELSNSNLSVNNNYKWLYFQKILPILPYFEGNIPTKNNFPRKNDISYGDI